MESPRLSRAAGFNPDAIKRERYYSVFCNRRWSDQKTEFVIQRWLQRYPYGREKGETVEEQSEGTNHPGPSTSTRDEVVSSDRDRRAEIAEIVDEESTADPKDGRKYLKPIIKSGPSARTGTATVKFQLPISTAETISKPEKVIVRYTGRFAKFLNRPICRMITGCLCCVMLPCTLLCATLFYFAEFPISRRTASR